MLKLLGAAVAAVALSFAGSASAAVLFQKSGTLHDLEIFAFSNEWDALLTANGALQIAVVWDLDPGESASAGLTFWSHRIYSEGTLETVPDALDWFYPGQTGGMRSWSWAATSNGFTLNLTDWGNYACQDWQPGQKCMWDTLRFLQVATGGGRYEVGYDLTINSIEGSTVPEPATWAMMIAGFGLIGSAVRRRDRQALAA